MGQREDIIKIAQAELGYLEGKNNDNKYGRTYGSNNVAWCGYFVSYCADQAQIAKDVFCRGGYVPTMADWYIARGRFKARGKYIPLPGDVIFFDFNHNGNSDHIGLVEKVAGDTVYTIEGNTSKAGESGNGDGVWRKSRKLTSSYIRGYGVPDYKEDDMDKVKLDIENWDGKTQTLDGFYGEKRNIMFVGDLPKLFPVKVTGKGSKIEITLDKAKIKAIADKL